MLRTLLEEFERHEHLRRGYDIVIGPQILKTELWQRSGHWDNYRENMYFTEVDGLSYGIKPMNCLSHMLIYKSKLRSYRICLFVILSWARCIATKNRACSTA